MFRFRRYRDRLYWLVLHRPEVDVCLFDPGHAVNLEIDAEVIALAKVCLGHHGLLEAMRAGDVEVHGAPHYRKALPSWLGTTHFAAAAATASAASH